MVVGYRLYEHKQNHVFLTFTISGSVSVAVFSHLPLHTMNICLSFERKCMFNLGKKACQYARVDSNENNGDNMYLFMCITCNQHSANKVKNEE